MNREVDSKIKFLIKNREKIPENFWTKNEAGNMVVWFLDREDGTAGDYETSQERFGITFDGQVVWGYSSGCSCWSGWESSDYQPPKDYKEFTLDVDAKFQPDWIKENILDEIIEATKK